MVLDWHSLPAAVALLCSACVRACCVVALCCVGSVRFLLDDACPIVANHPLLFSLLCSLVCVCRLLLFILLLYCVCMDFTPESQFSFLLVGIHQLLRFCFGLGGVGGRGRIHAVVAFAFFTGVTREAEGRVRQPRRQLRHRVRSHGC